MSPPDPLPNAIGRESFCDNKFANEESFINDLIPINPGLGFGTSIPTRDSPKTGVSILIEGVFKANDKSFSLDIIESTFTLFFNSTSFMIWRPLASVIAFPSESNCFSFFVFVIQPGFKPYKVTTGPG